MTTDEKFMSRALECAARAWGETSPNPMVGAVVTSGDEVLAATWHRRAGELHAEPQALEQALDALSSDSATMPSGADLTLYVNLEPCNHRGRTPPCTEAILSSSVRRVVVALEDPNPSVAGGGIARLRQAGISVKVGVQEVPARELNHAFWGRQLRRRPFVALKVALSGDGCVAEQDGQPARITGDVARRHTHHLRAGYDAILVGIRTLVMDRPRLDCRLYEGPGNSPRRLVLDPGLRLQKQQVQPGDEKLIVLCCAKSLLSMSSQRRGELEAAVEFEVLPGTRQQLQLDALPAVLQKHALFSLLVEGGGDTHRRFIEAELWDRMVVYRNDALRLRGLPWSAAAAWAQQSAVAIKLGEETLGDTCCTVFTHRDAWQRCDPASRSR